MAVKLYVGNAMVATELYVDSAEVATELYVGDTKVAPSCESTMLRWHRVGCRELLDEGVIRFAVL